MPVRYGISLSGLRLADALLARTYKFQIPAQTEHQHAHFRSFALMSALPPCVDGSELARTFLNGCSIGRCSHVFGLFARFT
jgi:hypothetical protein